MTQRVSYNTFKSDLDSVGIEAISSAPSDHWIVEGIGDYGERLAAKAKERADKAEEGADKAEEGADKAEATFIDAIKKVTIVTPKERISRELYANPVGIELEDIDIEAWLLTDGRLKDLENALYKMTTDGGGELVNMFSISHYCAIQVRCNDALFHRIAALPEVARMSRPLQMRASARPSSNIMDYSVEKNPEPDAPGILVIDSGIVRHPLLEPAIAKFVPVGGRNEAGADMYDDSGHGTSVAGVAAYGDVQACVDNKAFQPKVLLYSAKVLKRGPDGEAVFDGLIDEKIKRAVDRIAEHHPACRIVNLSLGDSARTVAPGMPQPRLATLIDHLSNTHKNLLFVVSAGNIEEDAGSSYPHYFLHRPPATHLIDPATSAHAITVGSIFRRQVGFGHEDHPSPVTRVGPGLGGMIKPDVVEYGGGYVGPGSESVLTMNRAWAQDGRLFMLDAGTSMSAPKVAHTLALLQRAMPDASRSLLKALLISSAEIPSLRPSPLDSLSSCKSNTLSSLLHIYGYGKPDLGRAVNSKASRAVFVHDGSMHLNHAELFAVRVPDMFIETRGHKTIEVTLAFDPPTDSRRRDYLGAVMKCHLYKNTDLGTVRKCYEAVDKAMDQNAPTPSSIKGNKIKLLPGIGLQGTGMHQKMWATSRGDLGIDPSHPLVLVVIVERKWIKEQDYMQGHSVVVTFSHSSGIDIYSALKSVNRARARGGAAR